MKKNVIKKTNGLCKFCGKREAEQFCDFIYDYRGPTLISRTGEVQEPEPIACDNEMCTECAERYRGHGFCPSCETIREKIKLLHDHRNHNLDADVRYRKGGE